MIPRSSYKNIADGGSINLINPPNAREVSALKWLCSILLPNFKHLIARQFRVTVGKSPLKSTLSYSVVDIVGLSSKKKVIRFYARRVVAFDAGQADLRVSTCRSEFRKSSGAPSCLEMYRSRCDGLPQSKSSTA